MLVRNLLSGSHNGILARSIFTIERKTWHRTIGRDGTGLCLGWLMVETKEIPQEAYFCILCGEVTHVFFQLSTNIQLFDPTQKKSQGRFHVACSLEIHGAYAKCHAHFPRITLPLGS